MSVTFTIDISNAKSTNMNGMNNIIKEVKLLKVQMELTQ